MGVKQCMAVTLPSCPSRSILSRASPVEELHTLHPVTFGSMHSIGHGCLQQCRRLLMQDQVCCLIDARRHCTSPDSACAAVSRVQPDCGQLRVLPLASNHANAELQPCSAGGGRIRTALAAALDQPASCFSGLPTTASLMSGLPKGGLSSLHTFCAYGTPCHANPIAPECPRAQQHLVPHQVQEARHPLQHRLCTTLTLRLMSRAQQHKTMLCAHGQVSCTPRQGSEQAAHDCTSQLQQYCLRSAPDHGACPDQGGLCPAGRTLKVPHNCAESDSLHVRPGPGQPSIRC